MNLSFERPVGGGPADIRYSCILSGEAGNTPPPLVSPQILNINFAREEERQRGDFLGDPILILFKGTFLPLPINEKIRDGFLFLSSFFFVGKRFSVSEGGGEGLLR